MGSSISHSKNNFEGIRSHNPTKLLCPLVLKKYSSKYETKRTREITSLTGSSSHEELNRPGTLWPNHTPSTTATPTTEG